MKNTDSVLSDFLSEEELSPESFCSLLTDIDSAIGSLEDTLTFEGEYQNLRERADETELLLETKRGELRLNRDYNANKKLRDEIMGLRKSLTETRRLMNSNTMVAESKRLQKDAKRMREALTIFDETGVMPEWAGIFISKTREEVMGITRERIEDVLIAIDKGEKVDRGELVAEPSIHEGVRLFLKRKGIDDRLSYEKALVYYGNFFPHHLMEITLGRKLGRTVTEAEMAEAGDELYGELDSEPVIQQVGQLFFTQKINSGTKITGLTDSRLKDILKNTRAGSVEFLVRILGKSGYSISEGGIKKTLADILYPE